VKIEACAARVIEGKTVLASVNIVPLLVITVKFGIPARELDKESRFALSISMMIALLGQDLR